MKIALLLSLAASSLAFCPSLPSPKLFHGRAFFATSSGLLATSSRRSFVHSATLLLLPTTALAREGYSSAYLSEPTEEFKESERQRAEYKKKEVEIKKYFTSVIQILVDPATKTDADVKKCLTDLRDLTSKFAGLPDGVKKDDLIKLIRRKKADGSVKNGYWTTDVEIEYQNLVREILYQQNPNKDKELVPVSPYNSGGGS